MEKFPPLVEGKKISTILSIFKLEIYILGFKNKNDPLWTKRGFPGSWEVFKKLPGGGGFVLTKYEPVASHGDPVHGRIRRKSDVNQRQVT